VVEREEHYREGLRDGALRWWSVLEELPEGADPMDDVPFIYRQGPLIREGSFERGAAHGPFKFFDQFGGLTHEVVFEHGWPSGTCTVHPSEATRGFAEPSTVRYDVGVPVSWSIAPFAYSSVTLDREGKSPATLASIVREEAAVLIDCTRTELPISGDDVAALDGVPLIGVGEKPRQVKIGAREIEIVTDPQGKLGRAYGYRGRLLKVTLIRAGGSFAGSGDKRIVRTARQRLAKRS
jgi:hypothetical protein